MPAPRESQMLSADGSGLIPAIIGNPMTAAVYNSPHPEMFLPSSRVRWAWCACLLVTRLAGASDWRAPESQLAAKIAALTGASVISLEIRNLSSIAPSDVEEIRRDLT